MVSTQLVDHIFIQLILVHSYAKVKVVLNFKRNFHLKLSTNLSTLQQDTSTSCSWKISFFFIILFIYKVRLVPFLSFLCWILILFFSSLFSINSIYFPYEHAPYTLFFTQSGTILIKLLPPSLLWELSKPSINEL